MRICAQQDKHKQPKRSYKQKQPKAFASQAVLRAFASQALASQALLPKTIVVPANRIQCTTPLSLVMTSDFFKTTFTKVPASAPAPAPAPAPVTESCANYFIQKDTCSYCGAVCILYTNMKCFKCVSVATQEAAIHALQKMLI